MHSHVFPLKVFVYSLETTSITIDSSIVDDVIHIHLKISLQRKLFKFLCYHIDYSFITMECDICVFSFLSFSIVITFRYDFQKGTKRRNLSVKQNSLLFIFSFFLNFV